MEPEDGGVEAAQQDGLHFVVQLCERAEPGSVLVLRAQQETTDEVAAQISDALERTAPQVSVLLLGPDVTLEAVLPPRVRHERTETADRRSEPQVGEYESDERDDHASDARRPSADISAPDVPEQWQLGVRGRCDACRDGRPHSFLAAALNGARGCPGCRELDPTLGTPGAALHSLWCCLAPQDETFNSPIRTRVDLSPKIDLEESGAAPLARYRETEEQ